MKIAIVDDEQIWIDNAREYVENHHFRCGNKQIDSYKDGESFLRSDIPYDIVIIDIEMPRMDGLETAAQYKKLYPNSILIILTSHTEFSMDGYLVEAFRYIDKSRLREKLPEALRSADKKLTDHQFIGIEIQGKGAFSIRTDRIVYVDIKNRNLVIHTEKNEYRCVGTLREMEEKLRPYHFIRCHHSCIVNLDHIDNIKRLMYGEITLDGGIVVEVSERKRSALRREYITRINEIANA
ncbi:MAG: response regulator transcription factor [Lachnospiraceae bacterium]|nr:response regulator transcription factor [Lachnospiraceae bacterium]